MVEFALPKNSRITGGKTWPKPPGATEMREYKIYRWNPDDGQNPGIDTYYIDTHDCGPMVLDGLIWIKNNIDPTLTFRRSCREGVCGSCAMNIDGQNTLACTKSMHDVKDGAVKVNPLPHQPVIKDLVTDMESTHWEKIRRVTPWLLPHGEAPEREYIVEPESMLDITQSMACIQCGACVSSCLSMEADPLFIGPAALAKAYRFVGDPRDDEQFERLCRAARERLAKFVGADGVSRNFSQGSQRRTDATLDMAIEGQGFFKVTTKAGDRYTRDGHFRTDDQGVVTTQAGDPVSDDGGGQITIDPTKTGAISISPDGIVSQGSERIGKVGVYQFDSLSALEKSGDNQYQNASNQQPVATTDAKVRQGMLESSNVNPIVQITKMIEVNRAYESVTQMMSSESDLSRNSVARLGKSN